MEDVDKTQYKDFSFILYISIFILVLFAIKFNDNFLKFLSGNIIPELIGICIELLVIILVFNIWQDKKEHKKILFMKKDFVNI